jgi:hypothetical protein
VLPPASTARERLLPVHPVLADLLPQAGLQRGTVVHCRGGAAESLALLTAGAASFDGAWTAIAGVPTLGIRAAAELGLVLDRLVIVREPPAGFGEQQWGETLAVMIDGFDLVLVGGQAVSRLRPAMARRVQARAQSRGAVLVLISTAADDGAGGFRADIDVHGDLGEWVGLGQGYGCARSRELQITVAGRRIPRPQRVAAWLPSDAGDCESVVAPAVPFSRAADATSEAAMLQAG